MDRPSVAPNNRWPDLLWHPTNGQTFCGTQQMDRPSVAPKSLRRGRLFQIVDRIVLQQHRPSGDHSRWTGVLVQEPRRLAQGRDGRPTGSMKWPPVGIKTGNAGREWSLGWLPWPIAQQDGSNRNVEWPQQMDRPSVIRKSSGEDRLLQIVDATVRQQERRSGARASTVGTGS